ncbi:myb-like protein AA [Contarinia nasturtii]|uniref:myb-like protein AA n=1 Tax=Contarinia nasturtii TaxID=265458 RepID=UPI0012D42210|nr:myb-like protein AA [Contarinia nasturtii]
MARYFTYLFTILLIFYSDCFFNHFVQSQQNQPQQNQQQQQQNRPQQNQQQQQQQNRPQQNQPQPNQQNRPQQAQQPQQNAARPTVCAKLDFNRAANPDFGPEFVTKQYKPGTQPAPFRQPFKNYLSANVNDFTFGISKTKFSLSPTSHLETAVFFQSVGNAFFDIIVYDVSNNQQEILHVTGTKGWTVLKKNITKNIQNARIKMNVNNLTPQCVLAIQYLHILNTAIKTPDCSPTPPPPTKPPPPRPPTTMKPQVTQKPADPQQVWLWAITATCLGIVLILLILIGIYCIMERRKRSKNLES